MEVLQWGPGHGPGGGLAGRPQKPIITCCKIIVEFCVEITLLDILMNQSETLFQSSVHVMPSKPQPPV